MSTLLDSGVKLVRNVGRFNIGRGSISELSPLLLKVREDALLAGKSTGVVFIVDDFFQLKPNLSDILFAKDGDFIEFVSAEFEPTTGGIDAIASGLVAIGMSMPAAIVGFGGGIAMDTAKAISNLLTNGGKASDYQGWDLVKKPGIFKIGIPTISGTGAEATRTCVMTNTETGLKLGMNSDFTVFDHIILDSDLTVTVPRDQYFFIGMDAYIHCVEALAGSYRNPIGDAYCRETLNLCRQIFLEGDMQSADNRERMMVASYLGGCAIATSYVGLVHPLSAALSVVLGVHHCVGNCIVMSALSDYYSEAHKEFLKMVDIQGVSIPRGVCKDLKDVDFRALYRATLMHERPLINALGEDFKSILTLDRVTELFKRM